MGLVTEPVDISKYNFFDGKNTTRADKRMR